MLDQLQRSVDLKQKPKPKRIVSLVPSQTELLVYLGLEASLVGITKFCVHPNHLLKSKTIVGGTKQIHVDKINILLSKPKFKGCKSIQIPGGQRHLLRVRIGQNDTRL